MCVCGIRSPSHTMMIVILSLLALTSQSLIDVGELSNSQSLLDVGELSTAATQRYNASRLVGVGRQMDPCRETISGRMGNARTVPNAITKSLGRMSTWAEHRPHPEVLRGSTRSWASNACRSVLLHGKKPNLATKVCGDALSFYQNQVGRTGGEPWSELKQDTGLTVEEVIIGLDLYQFWTTTIGLIIDETSSMYYNMNQVIIIYYY